MLIVFYLFFNIQTNVCDTHFILPLAFIWQKSCISHKLSIVLKAFYAKVAQFFFPPSLTLFLIFNLKKIVQFG